jgi:hypothetical protein
MHTLANPPTRTAPKAEYARATWRTAQVMADKSASLMDRLRAAEAEEAAAREAEPELEAGI